MSVKYKSFFRNNYIDVETAIDPDCSMLVNGVLIETDGFECLSIESFKNYTKEQLKIFDCFINKYGSCMLINYNLKVLIPVNVVEKNTGNNFCENIIIEINNSDDNIIGKLRFLDYDTGNICDVKSWDVFSAFDKLHGKIKQNFIVKICAFCKKSSYNPYGGIDFFSHLCFNECAEEFCKLDLKNKFTIGPLMNNNKGKFKNVSLTSSCNEYME